MRKRNYVKNGTELKEKGIRKTIPGCDKNDTYSLDSSTTTPYLTRKNKQMNISSDCDKSSQNRKKLNERLKIL